MKISRLVMAVFFISLIALLTGFLLVKYKNNEKSSLTTIPINSHLGGSFKLPSTLGKPLDSESLRGKVVLMTFGYANCEDICPIGLMRLHEVIKGLEKDKNNLSVIFVSFDSSNRLDNLAEYIHKYDSSIIGVTGNEQEISILTKKYGVIYPKERKINGGPSFAHNGFIYLLDNNGKVRAIFNNRTPKNHIINGVKSLITYS